MNIIIERINFFDEKILISGTLFAEPVELSSPLRFKLVHLLFICLAYSSVKKIVQSSTKSSNNDSSVMTSRRSYFSSSDLRLFKDFDCVGVLLS